MSARDDAERIVGQVVGAANSAGLYDAAGDVPASEYQEKRLKELTPALVRLVAAAIDLADHDPNGSPPDEAVAWTVDADYLRELAAAVRALTGEEHGDE